MENPESEEKYKEPMPALVIAVINIGAMILYLAVIINSRIPDSAAAFLLFCHLAICITFGINSRRPVWWICASVIAFPLSSLLFYHPH